MRDASQIIIEFKRHEWWAMNQSELPWRDCGMAAVAARATTVQKQTAAQPVRTTRRTRVRRSPRSSFRRAGRLVLLVSALAFLFGYVNVYASLAKTSYSRSRLVQMCREEKLKNERLKVEWTRRCSPQNVVAAAEKSGMVYASNYEYMGASQTVASAKRFGDD